MNRDTRRAFRILWMVCRSDRAWAGWKLFMDARRKRILAHRKLRKELEWR